MDVDVNRMLDTAMRIAAEAHAGQTDKAGQPYILHPIRLSMKFDNLEDKAIMLMHDVVEDSNWTIVGLFKLGVFSEYALKGIEILTHRHGHSYSQYIDDILNSGYRKCKIADLEDNLDILRFKNELTCADLERIQKYHRAWLRLTSLD